MIKPNYKSKDATELLNYAEHIFEKIGKKISDLDPPVQKTQERIEPIH